MLELIVKDAAGHVLQQEPLFKDNAVRSVIELATTGAKPGDRLTVETRLPIVDVQGYWLPRMKRPSLKLDWRIHLDTAAHKDFPFIAFFNQGHVNRLSIGVTGTEEVVLLSAEQDQSTCTYRIAFEIVLGGKAQALRVAADRTDGPWTESLAWYRAQARPQGAPQYSAAAWEPVFCTWYACHAAVHQDWTEANARIAADLGFKTLIVDDGWCTNEDKAVSPATLLDWYAEIGEWEAAPRKFPDFPGHVRRVKELGLRYLLWVAPLMIGVRTATFARHGDACFPEETEGYRIADPAREALCDAILGKMAALLRDNGLDGLKVDFLDAAPACVERARGEAMARFMARLKDAVFAAAPDGLIEYRQKYATPATLDWATQFRAGDVPFDFIENLHEIAQVRLCVGDGAPVHADPAFWHPDETAENIARHMICAIAGVPMLSVDLTKTPQATLDLIKRWTAFYSDHTDTFRSGRWEAHYLGTGLAALVCRSERETVAVVLDAHDLSGVVDPEGRPTWVLNASMRPISGPFGKVLDHELNPVNSPDVPPAGAGVV